MPAHDAASRAVRDALVAGRLERAKEAVQPLVALSVPPDLESPAVEKARRVAESVSSAGSLGEASQATARMLAECQGCHRYAAEKHPRPLTPPPDEEGGVVREMTRHAWALDQIWDAVLWANPDGVAAAAALLNEEDLVTGHGVQSLPDEVRPLEAQLHGLAVGASNAATLDDQATLLGDMLATCGACHQATAAEL